MAHHISEAVLDLGTVLDLPPFRSSGYEILTPQPDLRRSVRWAHALEAADPAAMLQGDELVLSTLTHFTEDLTDLRDRLRIHLRELAEVGAAALAVEVFADRPRLLAALRDVAAVPTGTTDTALPVILFGRFVRFVEMTEHIHRALIQREPGTAQSYEALIDPQFAAASGVLRQLHRSDPSTSAQAKARSLGLTDGAAYLAFICRFPHGSADEHDRSRRLLAHTLREAATTLHCPALIGGWEDGDLAGIVSGPDGHDLPDRVRRLVARTRELTASSHRSRAIPQFTVGMGHPRPGLSASVLELGTALDVAESITALRRRRDRWTTTPQREDSSDCWSPQDVGLDAFLAWIADDPIAQSFADWQVEKIPHAEYGPTTELVRGLVETRCSKTELAELLSISRPTLYHRLSRLEHLLGGPITQGPRLTALYIALRLRSLSSDNTD